MFAIIRLDYTPGPLREPSLARRNLSLRLGACDAAERTTGVAWVAVTAVWNWNVCSRGPIATGRHLVHLPTEFWKKFELFKWHRWLWHIVFDFAVDWNFRQRPRIDYDVADPLLE